MARTKLEVDRNELAQQIVTLEASQTFRNPSWLFKALEQTAWAKSIGLKASTAYQRVIEFGIILQTVPGRVTAVAKARQANGTLPVRVVETPEAIPLLTVEEMKANASKAAREFYGSESDLPSTDGSFTGRELCHLPMIENKFTAKQSDIVIVTTEEGEKRQAEILQDREERREARQGAASLTTLSADQLMVIIKKKCLHCACGDKEEITLCKIESCPLFPVRPFQNEKVS